MSKSNDQHTAGFEQVLRPQMEALFRLALRLTGNRAEADDLFQDVLVKIYLRIDDLLDIDDPPTWLRRVMYNHFVDNRRKYARRRLIVVDEHQLGGITVDDLAGDDTPQRNVERHDDIMRLQSALDRLSNEHREVVLLHDSDGYKLEEIHELTGEPIGTVKSRLHRARARLREILDEDGTFS